MELYNDILNLIKSLDFCINELRKRGEKKAQTEHDYRVALSKAMLIKRDEGLPVTILGDVCRGMNEIAKLKLDRDIAESLYDSVMQKIYSIKLNISILENQLGREWGQSK